MGGLDLWFTHMLTVGGRDLWFTHALNFVVKWTLEGTNATHNLPYRLHKSATPSPKATYTPNFQNPFRHACPVTHELLWVCLEGTNANCDLPYRLHKSATPSPRATFTPNSPMVCLHFHKRHSTNHLAVFTENIGLMFHLSLCELFNCWDSCFVCPCGGALEGHSMAELE